VGGRKHLHWIHFRKTIVISLLASLFCSFRFAFRSCCLLHSLLYIFITLRIIGRWSSPVRRVMTFHTRVYEGVLRHFLQVVWIENPSLGELHRPIHLIRNPAVPLRWRYEYENIRHIGETCIDKDNGRTSIHKTKHQSDKPRKYAFTPDQNQRSPLLQELACVPTSHSLCMAAGQSY